MRDSKNRLALDTVFVLGAGSTFGATQGDAKSPYRAPLDSNFVSAIQRLDYQKPGWIPEAVERFNTTLSDQAVNEPNEIGLESFVMRYLSHFDFLSNVHPKRARNLIPATEFRDLISRLICLGLSRVREVKKSPLQTIAFHVAARERMDVGLQNRIITFNYDTLLDRHLLDHFSPQEVYFDRLLPTRTSALRRTARHPYPLLVKLHGSTNWRCDLQEIDIAMEAATTDHLIDRIWLSKSRVEAPGTQSAPCLIPPLPSKPITSIRLFRHLWKCAFEYLTEAQQIVIIGYSLPANDTLARSLFSNFQNSKLRQVHLVDPNAAMITRWRRVLRRSGIRKNVNWHYYEDADEFAEGFDYS